ALRIARLMALRRSGRLSVRMTTGPSLVTSNGDSSGVAVSRASVSVIARPSGVGNGVGDVAGQGRPNFLHLHGDAAHEFTGRRGGADQALRDSAGPDAGLGVAVRVDHAAAGAGDEVLDVLEATALVQDVDDLVTDRVLGRAH